MILTVSACCEPSIILALDQQRSLRDLRRGEGLDPALPADR